MANNRQKPLDNPLTISHRDSLARVLQEYPKIRDILDRAKASGMDMSERESNLESLKQTAETLLDQFFEGYRP